jgi:hypothetical protein
VFSKKQRNVPSAALAGAVLLTGLAVRLALCFVLVPAWQASTGAGTAPDHYPTLAESLLDRHTLGYGAFPTTARGPGFPLWLAAGMTVSRDDRWVAFWGGIPGIVAGACLTHVLSRRIRSWAALFGGVVAVAHPLPALTAARALSDDFYAALGLGAALLFHSAVGADPARRGRCLVAAVLLAGQLLTRTTAMLTLVALAVGALRRRRAGWFPLTSCLALALVPAALWSIRSSRLEGRPVLVHSAAAYTFWVGEGQFRHGYDWLAAREDIMAVMLREAGSTADPKTFQYTRLTPTEAADLERRLGPAAVRHVLDRPGSFCLRCGQGVLRFWFQAQTTRRTALWVATVAPLLLLALFGVGRGEGATPLAWSLLATVVLHNLLYACMSAYARMGVQVFPAVAFFAAIGASRLHEGLAARTRGRTLRAGS